MTDILVSIHGKRLGISAPDSSTGKCSLLLDGDPVGASASVDWASITGKPATFAPVIGTTTTTAMAGDKVPTTTDRGGVLQQSAITALTDSSGGTSGGNTIAAIPAVVAAATSADTATLPTKESVDATVTAIKNDVATLAAKYNALLAAVKAAGITA